MCGHKGNGKIKIPVHVRSPTNQRLVKVPRVAQAVAQLETKVWNLQGFMRRIKKKQRAIGGEIFFSVQAQATKKQCPLGTDTLVWSDVYRNMTNENASCLGWMYFVRTCWNQSKTSHRWVTGLFSNTPIKFFRRPRCKSPSKHIT